MQIIGDGRPRPDLGFYGKETASGMIYDTGADGTGKKVTESVKDRKIVILKSILKKC